MSNPVDTLKAMIGPESLSTEQREAIDSLSAEEVTALLAIQQKLKASGAPGFKVEGEDEEFLCCVC